MDLRASRATSTRCAGWRQLRDEGRDRASRRHELRHRPSARAGRARHSESRRTRSRSRSSTAGRRGDERLLPARMASGCWPTARWPAAFSTDRWLGAPEPAEGEIADWSKMKYKRFIDAVGGWGVLQAILRALGRRRRQHGVSIANVATRWVLEQPAVAAVIVGARLGEREHRADNLQLFSFAWTRRTGRDRLGAGRDRRAARRLRRRIPPARLPHRLGRSQPSPRGLPQGLRGDADRRAGRTGCASIAAASGSRSAATAAPCGSGDRILVSGTTATHGAGEMVCPGDPAAQTTSTSSTRSRRASPRSAARLEDVVRTRIYVRDASQWEPVARAHGRYFGDDPAGQHAGRGSALVGGLRGGDRGRGDRRLKPSGD